MYLLMYATVSIDLPTNGSLYIKELGSKLGLAKVVAHDTICYG